MAFDNNIKRGHALRIAVGIIILALLFAGSAGAAIITVPDNSTKIQDAIDNAGAGDTIQVYSGTYYENVNITKQLILRGIGNPVVYGLADGKIVTLAADGIILDGFTVKGENFLKTGIMVTSNNNTLIGNNASNNGIGIFLSNSSKNKLINNNANYNGGCGGKFGGIFLSYSNNNTLINNNASSNSGCTGYSMGIFLEYSNNNTLSGNKANLNFNYGIYLYNSKYNTLIGNEANNNTGLSCPCNSGTGPGTGIRLVSSSNNTLSGNNVSNQEYVSAEHGYNLGGIGIDLYLSSNNKIYNNYINNIDNNAFNNSYYTEMRGSNIWNTTRIPGPNVVGGQYLGGNYWANPNGTGFSQTCTDANGDGICDSPYVLDANNTDYRPLASIPIISFINPTPVNGAFLAQNYANVNTTVSNALTAFIDWNHSLVGWLRFNNESGESPSFFRDWSSWGNNGTCSGTKCPTSTPGKFGNALKFDGVNDYIDVGNKASLDITGPITIEAWINPAVAQEKCFDRVSGNYGVMSKVSAPTNSVNWSWQLRFGAPGGRCYLGFQFNGNPEGARWVTVKQNLTPGQWYHVVGTFNGTHIASYLNGNLKDSNRISAIKGYNNKLLIGNDGWSDLFNGKIDEVRINKRALSPGEIKASYDAGIYRLSRNFISLASGTYNYQAFAENQGGIVNQTEKRDLTLVSSP